MNHRSETNARDLTTKTSAYEGEWGWLENEPCRFCHRTGKVYFLIDDGPEGRKGISPMRCDHCKRTWTQGEATA
jgi:hypothetical protein